MAPKCVESSGRDGCWWWRWTPLLLSLPLDLISQLPHTHYCHLSPPLIRRRFLSVLVCGMDGGGGVVFVWLDDDGAGVGVQSHHIEYL